MPIGPYNIYTCFSVVQHYEIRQSKRDIAGIDEESLDLGRPFTSVLFIRITGYLRDITLI